VSNREIAYGSGNLCAMDAGGRNEPTCFASEETSWRAQPEMAPDGRRILYSSYQGRQWHQLWLTTLTDNAPLPLTFGEFDRTQARWSPNGRRIAYISNETGNVTLWIQDVVGGERRQIVAKRRKYLAPVATLRLRITDAQGRTMPGRFSVFGSDRRQYGPDEGWLHADDGIDPVRQREETRYFHCASECSVTVPVGEANIPRASVSSLSRPMRTSPSRYNSPD
jgi:TolB protein